MQWHYNIKLIRGKEVNRSQIPKFPIGPTVNLIVANWKSEDEREDGNGFRQSKRHFQAPGSSKQCQCWRRRWLLQATWLSSNRKFSTWGHVRNRRRTRDWRVVLSRSYHAPWGPYNSCARHFINGRYCFVHAARQDRGRRFCCFQERGAFGSSSGLTANSLPANAETSWPPLPSKQRVDNAAAKSQKEGKHRKKLFGGWGRERGISTERSCQRNTCEHRRSWDNRMVHIRQQKREKSGEQEDGSWPTTPASAAAKEKT